jgi:uncharacterized Zn finger protein
MERIGRGPWARWLATAVVPNEGSTTAERGSAFVREGRVHDLAVETGEIHARVAGGGGAEYAVTIAAAPIPQRTWAEVVESAEGDESLEAAVAGREQSLHLHHTMTTDWGEPLVPRTHALRQSCSCPVSEGREPGNPCQHIAAVAYAAAQAVDDDPTLLLRWRGCLDAPAPEPVRPEEAAVDPWRAGPLPAPRPLRPLPPGAVLKRLGPSGVRVATVDLAEVLERAYRAF